MKTVTILEDVDIAVITKHLEQIDIEVGSLYNKDVPVELMDNIKEINHNIQKLGELLGIWDFDLENR